MSKARKVVVALLAACMACALFALAACGSSQSSSSASSGSSSAATEKVQVPNVVSLKQGDAEKAVTSAGLKVGQVTVEHSDTVRMGSVISQTPKPLSDAEKGSKVDLVISCGKKVAADVKVPDLTGKTQADAEAELSKLGLIGVPSNPEETDAVQPGCVFKQSVAAGSTLKEGSKVAFTTAVAVGNSEVPDVVGKNKDDAKKALTGAGFGFDSTVAYDDAVPEGNVVSQSIPAKTSVKRGTTVSVCLSLGPKPAGDVKVPDLSTFSWTAAENALLSAGLQPRYTGDPAGFVVAQDVAAGTMVAPGTVVTVVLENQVPTVTVPDLTGMSFDSAEQALLALNLDLATSGKGGTVASQWPEAGAEVERHTAVYVVLAE